VTIYDIAGKRTATVTDQDHRPGYYNQAWNRTDSHGRAAANGIYFVEVRTKTQSDRKKVVLTR
jgi:flagellar hook assembly protein FlgD